MDTKKIFDAVECDDLEEVKRLMKEKDVPPMVKIEIAGLAVKKKNFILFKYVIESDPSIVKKDGNRILLQKAVKHGALDIVRYLVKQHKVNILHEYLDKLTPSVIHLAIKKNHLHILKYFIEKLKVNVNEPIKKQRPLLHEALLHKRDKIIKYLAENEDIGLTLLDRNGESVLYPAASSGNLDFMKYVLDKKEAKIDINQRNKKSGSTLVMEVAKQSEHFDILKYLVDEKHADISIPDKYNNSILHFTKSKDFCEYFVQRGADINWKNLDGNTPLYNSVDRNCHEVMEYLVEKGTDVNNKNNLGVTPLNLIVTKDSKEWRVYDTCKYFIKHGADINLADNFGNSPLHTAIIGRSLNFTCDTELCEFLIRHGADVNKVNDKGKTPLEYAVIYNRFEICKILVEHKANFNHRNNQGETPVHRAVMAQEKMSILEYLVGVNHADINIARKYDNMTPLHIAASKNYGDVCKYLIENGADIKAIDGDGKTPKQRALDENLIQYMETVSVKRIRRSIDLQAYRLASLVQPYHYNNLRRITYSIPQEVKDLKKGDATYFGLSYSLHFQNFLILTQALVSNVENAVEQWSFLSPKVNSTAQDAIFAFSP